MKTKSVDSDRFIDYSVLFILNAVGMVLELVASRLLSPFFGNSNFVWTAIIGIILLAGSLGNLLGGKISSMKNARFVVSFLLLIAAIYLALVPVLSESFLASFRVFFSEVRLASVISSIIFFLVPATILGVITPLIMKERIEKNKDKGKESGIITAIIAIGSLFGTFVGGFWLIPAIGTKMIFVLLSILIILCTICFSLRSKSSVKECPFLLYITLAISILISLISLVVGINEDSKSDVISIDTEYGRIIVEDSFRGSNPIRLYKQSGAYSSATYTDASLRNELVFEYVKKYDEAFKFIDVKDALMIGGAAYQYPKYYISHFADKKMDVVEIDPESTRIAKEYFYLDELISRYDNNGTRLGLFNEDGRVFMSSSSKKYDAIFNDVFSGKIPVGTMSTVEAGRLIKSKLNDGGVYFSNVLGSPLGGNGKFLRSEIKTLKTVFKNVYLMPVYQEPDLYVSLNWMLIATDSSKYVPEHYSYTITDEDILLTDDYCPIDSLVGD